MQSLYICNKLYLKAENTFGHDKLYPQTTAKKTVSQSMESIVELTPVKHSW